MAQDREKDTKEDQTPPSPQWHQPPPSHIPMQFGKYQISRELGRGGMGAIYLARHSELGHEVALKVLLEHQNKPKTIQRFQREAQLASRLRHPNIIRVLDFGRDHNIDYIVMDYIAGENLRRKIVREEGVKPEEALSLLLSIAEGVEYAHQNNIVHRDLKSANILLPPQGPPMISDFGIAKDLDSESTLTGPNTILGSPCHIAPEQIELKEIDHRADVYALGILMFEMLTGELPYRGTNVGIIYAQILHHPVPHIREHRPDIDPALDDICFRAMAKDREDRFTSAGHLIKALKQYQTGDYPTRGEPRPTDLNLDQDDEETEPLWRQVPMWMLVTAPFLVIAIGFLSFAILEKKNQQKKKNLPPPKTTPPPLPTISPTQMARLEKHCQLAKDLFDQGKFGPAEQALTQGLAAVPESTKALLFRAHCRAYLGRIKEARKDLSQIPESQTKPRHQLIVAYLHLREKNFSLAEKVVKKLVEKNYRNPEFSLVRSWLAWENNRTDLALKYLNRALEVRKRPDLVQFKLHLFSEKGTHKETLEPWLAAQKVYPKNDKVHFYTANIYLNLRKMLKSRQTFLKALEFNKKQPQPDHLHTHLQVRHLSLLHIGRNYALQGKFYDAIPYLEEALPLDPTHGVPYFWLGKSYLQTRRYREAIRIFEKGIKKAKNEDLYLLLIQTHWLLKEHDLALKAIERAKKVMARDKKHFLDYYRALTYVSKGRTSGSKKQLERGKEELKRFLRTCPDLPHYRKLRREAATALRVLERMK